VGEGINLSTLLQDKNHLANQKVGRGILQYTHRKVIVNKDSSQKLLNISLDINRNTFKNKK